MNPYIFAGLSEEVQQNPVVQNIRKVSSITNHFFKVFNITKDDVISRSRKANIASCRRCIAYTLRNNTNLTLRQIGECIGLSDHGSVKYLTEAHEGYLETNKEFKQKFESIKWKN